METCQIDSLLHISKREQENVQNEMAYHALVSDSNLSPTKGPVRKGESKEWMGKGMGEATKKYLLSQLWTEYLCLPKIHMLKP